MATASIIASHLYKIYHTDDKMATSAMIAIYNILAKGPLSNDERYQVQCVVKEILKGHCIAYFESRINGLMRMFPNYHTVYAYILNMLTIGHSTME